MSFLTAASRRCMLRRNYRTCPFRFRPESANLSAVFAVIDTGAVRHPGPHQSFLAETLGRQARPFMVAILLVYTDRLGCTVCGLN